MHPPSDDACLEQTCAIEDLAPYANNARTHSKKQVRQIADSIRRFGFCNPVLIADDNTIIAGHGRVEAAKLIEMTEVPVRRLSHLSKDEVRAYILADNKLAQNAGWDRDLLAIEMQGLIELDFDIEGLGFSMVEIDLTIGDKQASFWEADDAVDRVEPVAQGPAVTRAGELWLLGPHRLLCGDARSKLDVARLCDGKPATLLFTDPPYNVPIDGHVTGLGRIRHREFALASGEMDEAAFTAFLTDSLEAAASQLADGAIAYVCMDWRHMREVLAAGHAVFSELKNLCVWNKTNGGMGSFYRSKHELVFVFKKGTAPHINTFGLGDTGRYRTNVWDYPGISSLGASRNEELAMHPTVKPVALIADAIKDCSRRGDVILDVFGGSGSTMIAADQCGRVARLIEIDPLYCDTIIRRFERLTGEQARLAETGRTFADVTADRHGSGGDGNQDESLISTCRSIDRGSSIPASIAGDR
ncbi:MAG: DNA methylase N-4 [Hoeflea sp.]|uniref:site-specific DNA-methyltransferase n=1 Tax=Hoeflea sp. TaxID=1940281 RepID=UPI000C0CFF93|nr:DNA methyltransferase [Hoeflea sp.]PHR25779.1 MAG: DNA methylase N-4 [Hoeflea sp.]